MNQHSTKSSYLLFLCSLIRELNLKVSKNHVLLPRAAAHLNRLGPFSLAVRNHPGGPKPQIFMNGACSPSLLPALPTPMPFPLPAVPDYR